MKIVIKNKAKKKIEAQMKKDGFCIEEDTFVEMIQDMGLLLKQKASLFPAKSVFTVTDVDGFNANNSIFSTKKAYYISFTWLWIYRLHFYKSRKIEVAFLATLGHELGHKKAACHCPLFIVSKRLFDKSTKKETFLLRTIEVYCDFNGAFVADVTRTELIEAKDNEYKIGKEYKKSKKETDFIHPTHKSRMEYLKEHNKFSKELVEKIAKDNGYYNQAVIDSTWGYYQKVEEKDGYVPLITQLTYLASIILSTVLVLILVHSVFSIVAYIVLILFVK